MSLPKISIMSRKEIEEFYKNNPNIFDEYNVVSCLDTGLASPFSFSVYRDHWNELLTLHFDDVGNPDWDHTGPQYQPFCESHALRLIRWMDEADLSKKFIVHCWAGISRSSAIAVWIAVQLNEPVDELRKRYPRIKPNKLVLKLMEEMSLASDYIRCLNSVDGD